MTGIDTREELRRSAVKHLWMHNRGWAEMAERGEPVIMTGGKGFTSPITRERRGGTLTAATCR